MLNTSLTTFVGRPKFQCFETDVVGFVCIIEITGLSLKTARQIKPQVYVAAARILVSQAIKRDVDIIRSLEL